MAPVPAKQIFMILPIYFNFPSTNGWGYHEQLALRLRCRCDLRDVVHQQAVVGHVVLQVRMWPIRSPQHAIGERVDEPLRKRDDIAIRVLLAVERRRSADAQTLGAAHLRPDVLVLAHHADEQLELWSIHRLGHIGPPHVIDNDCRRQRREEIPQLR
jgi:hypothetical protein